MTDAPVTTDVPVAADVPAIEVSGYTEEFASSIPPRRVLVIDDELAGLTMGHLREVCDIADALNDINSPIVEELWSIAVLLKGFKPLAEAKPSEVLAYLNSDALIQEVVLTTEFQGKATSNLKDQFQSFLGKAESVSTLRKQVEKAYCKPAYDLTFVPDRPAVAELLKFDLVIFDLVLVESAAAVDELGTYLENLSKQCPDSLPCLIIMSSRPELKEKRLWFSTKSNISAAGLLILPKSEISRPGFGAEGLLLSDKRLFLQKDIAQHMRVFMRTWTEALENAKKFASTTLWNLDASTMQEIHLVSYSDRDPYDEHLSELISREYLWHVESAPAVRDSIDAMDKCFHEALADESIKHRFITPLADQKNAREFLTHFNWTGLASPEPFIEMETEDAVKRFNRMVPFGALLSPPEIKEDTLCYVHITQQCDLNKAIREKNGGIPAIQSAQFAVVKPVEIKAHDIPQYDGKKIVARNLKVGEKEYDFELQDGQQLALPIRDFIDFAKRKQLKVSGRLRHDMATYFLIATANHMTRPALLKPTRTVIRKAMLFLYGNSNPNGELLPFIDKDTGEPAVVSVSVQQDKKRFAFQDDNSIYIALWIREQLIEHYKENNIDTDIVCAKISIGVSNKETFVKKVTFRTFECSVADLKKTRDAIKPTPSADEVTLCLVYESKMEVSEDVGCE